MIPSGMRHQASLGGAPQDVPAWLLSALRAAGPQQVVVRDVDYVGARVQVYNSNGLRWARVLKTKTSGVAAGEIDMPNVNDIGLVVGTNGDEKSPVWLGGLDSIEPSNTLEKDEQFTSNADLVHRYYRKHETGSFTLLDKIGNFMSRLMKRETDETSPAKKNIDLQVGNDGTITITQYKADGASVGSKVSVAADGATVKVELGSGQSILLDGDQDLIEFVAGNMKLDATLVTLGSNTNQIPLVTQGFFTIYNALRALLATHVHTSTAPGNPTSTSPTLAVLATPDVPAPGTNVTEQVTGN
jgi:hypothetical protein